VTLIFDLSPWNWCALLLVGWATFLPILVFLRCFVLDLHYRVTPVRRITWSCDIHLWTKRSRRLSVMRVFVLRLYTKCEVHRPSFGRYCAFTVWVLIGLVKTRNLEKAYANHQPNPGQVGENSNKPTYPLPTEICQLLVVRHRRRFVSRWLQSAMVEASTTATLRFERHFTADHWRLFAVLHHENWANPSLDCHDTLTDNRPQRRYIEDP